MECLSVRDEDGRFNPVYGDCVLPQVIEAQTVILAIGQVADPALVPAGFATDARGLITADVRPRRSGPRTLRGRRRRLRSIDRGRGSRRGQEGRRDGGRYLRGEALVGGVEEQAVLGRPSRRRRRSRRSQRVERGIRPAEERRRDFAETALPFGGLQAQAEAERCLTCGSRSKIAYLDDCQVCKLCQHYCPTDAIEITEGALLGSLHGWDVVESGPGTAGGAR